jgi:hypothetical protein
MRCGAEIGGVAEAADVVTRLATGNDDLSCHRARQRRIHDHGGLRARGLPEWLRQGLTMMTWSMEPL